MRGFKKYVMGLALTAGALALPQIAQAQGKAPRFLPAGTVAEAPEGFMEMCMRDALLCASGAPNVDLSVLKARVQSAASRVKAPGQLGMAIGLTALNADLGTAALVSNGTKGRTADAEPRSADAPLDTKDMSRLVRKINSSTNMRIVQAADYDVIGVSEYWKRPDPVKHPTGDCEDIAIEKRMALIEAGFPAERLFYAVVYRAGFGLHTILIARLDEGDMVLDSATSRIVNWSQANYVWLRQQSPADPLTWSSIPGTTMG